MLKIDLPLYMLILVCLVELFIENIFKNHVIKDKFKSRDLRIKGRTSDTDIGTPQCSKQVNGKILRNGQKRAVKRNRDVALKERKSRWSI